MGRTLSEVLQRVRYIAYKLPSRACRLFVRSNLSATLIFFTLFATTTAADVFTSAIKSQYFFENRLSENDDGLGDIRAILQTHDGFMLIGADAGLYRYDGYNFEHIHIAEESKQYITEVRHISKLFEDSQKRLWVGSTVGILELDRSTNLLSNISQDRTTGFYVNDIAELNNGDIIFASYQGFKIFNPVTHESTLYTTQSTDTQGNLSDDTIYSIWVQDDRNIWLGTRKGLNHFDSTTKTFQTIKIKNIENQSDLAVHALKPNNNNGLWLGTNGGLIHYNIGTQQSRIYNHEANNPQSLSSNTVLTLLNDSKNQLWVGTDSTGLNLYNPQSDSFSHVQHEAGQVGTLSSNTIRTIYEDSQGDIWIGNYPSGLHYLDQSTIGLSHVNQKNGYENGLSHNSIMSISEDTHNNFWLGTDGGGLNYWNLKTNSYTHYKHDSNDPNTLASNAILDTYLKDNYLWLSMWGGGINRMNVNNDQIIRYPFTYKKIPGYSQASEVNSGNIWTIKDDKKGHIFLGTHNAGLAIFDTELAVFNHYTSDEHINNNNVPAEIIWDISISTDGRIWLATLSGICLFNPDTGKCPRPQGTEHLYNGTSDQSILSIFQDKNGLMWLGSDNGLYQYDPKTYELIRYGDDYGIENGTIRTIIEDNLGMLWVGHKRGISSFDRDTKTFTNYTRYQGQPLGEINPRASLLTTTGQLLFGSTNGLYIITPDKLHNTKYQSEIKITELKVLARPIRIDDGTNVLQKTIDRTKNIELSHNERMFTFEFSALNFRHVSTNRYSYFLEGFDKEWIHIGQQRSATYTNLNPGSYTFMVKASNVGLDWDSEPAVIKITILPPLWQTAWAHSIYVFLIALLGWIIFMLGRYKMRSDRFENLSITDPLTGLLNRAGIHNIVNKMIPKLGTQSTVGLILIDIDHFKSVNDNFGHDVGDDVLITLSDSINTSIRGSDSFGRWGGEEFILICPGSSEESIRNIANAVCQTAATTPIQTQGKSLTITVSIGYGIKAHNENFERALKRIDIALYHAKHNGRNRTEAASLKESLN